MLVGGSREHRLNCPRGCSRGQKLVRRLTQVNKYLGLQRNMVIIIPTLYYKVVYVL